MLFAPDRALLRPQFEAYRLAPGDVPKQHTFALPTKAAAPGNDASLGYKELKARAMHGALTIVPGDRAVCAYVDAEGYVTLAALDDALKIERVHRVQSTQSASILAVDAQTVAVCDGPVLSLLTLSADSLEARVHTHPLPEVPVPESETALPWRIVAAADQHVLLERARRASKSGPVHAGLGASSGAGHHTQTQTSFDVALVRYDTSVQLVWHLTGDEPVSAALIGETTLLGAEAPFGASASPPAPAAPASQPGKTPPYSWTQTDDTVTVAFALPATLTKHEIRVHFSRKGASIGLALREANITELGEEPAHADTEAALRQGTYESRALWGEIDVATSLWTWEHVQTRTAGETHVTGLLTLHIAKAHEGTRWSSVFEGDDSVSETLDPSELLTMLEGLEKYTENPGAGTSSLLQDGLEEEDELAGTRLVFTAVHADGTTSQSAPADAGMLLARTAPSNVPDARLLLKYDVDGLLFAPPKPLALAPWEHTETAPAISYVLASKRDAHPVYVHRAPGAASSTVLAIEPRMGGSRASLTHNVFVYRAAPDAKYGESRVFRLGHDDQPTGPVLGAGVVSASGASRLMCLCESTLHIVDNALFT